MSFSNSSSGSARAANFFALICGIVGAILLVPRIWPVLETPVWETLAGLYSFETARWLHIAAKIAIWPLVFCVIRVGLSMAFVAIGSWLDRRAM